MKEIWDHPFGHGKLKIERANKHIADIEKRLHASSDSNGPTMHVNATTGKQVLHYGLTDDRLRSDIALIVGDAIHNLHCALDIAWCGMFPATAAHRKFPIYPKKTREEFKGTLKGTGVTVAMLNLVVDGVKCYAGGDADILALHSLDIDDKHHLLIPVLTVVGISGVELENEDGSIDRFDVGITRPNHYWQDVSLGAKFKNHGQVRFKITFREGAPFENLEVVPALFRISAKVSRIVNLLQRMK